MIKIKSVPLVAAAEAAIDKANREIRSPEWREAVHLIRPKGRISLGVEMNAYLAAQALRKSKGSKREPRLSEDKKRLEELHDGIKKLDRLFAALSTTTATACVIPSSLFDRKGGRSLP